MYDLVGVVEHLGSSMKSGHYSSFVRRLVHRRHAAATAATAQLGQSPHLGPPPEISSSSNSGGQDSILDAALTSKPLSAPNNHIHVGSSCGSRELLDAPRNGGEASMGSGDAVEITGCTSHGGLSSQVVHDGSVEELLGVEVKWFKASDQHVKCSTEKEVLVSEAYVLLYQRCS